MTEEQAKQNIMHLGVAPPGSVFVAFLTAEKLNQRGQLERQLQPTWRLLNMCRFVENDFRDSAEWKHDSSILGGNLGENHA
jgi:hypothetical protein